MADQEYKVLRTREERLAFARSMNLFADMPKEEFVRYLGENGISIFHFDDEEDSERN